MTTFGFKWFIISVFFMGMFVFGYFMGQHDQKKKDDIKIEKLRSDIRIICTNMGL